VTSTLRHISFRRLGASSIQQRFLEDDRDVARFLGLRARSVAELLRRAPTGAGRMLRRETLVGALCAYAERHGAPEPVHAAAQALLDNNVHIVVTGQQPGLCGGPLYTLYKVATAILVNQSQDVQRVRIDRDHSNEPLRNIPVGRDVEKVLAEIDALLPQTEFRPWALSLFTPKHPNETFGDLLARLLFGLFGQHGLLVIEPRDLPPEAFAPLPKWWGKANEIREEVKVACDDLADIGIDVTLDPAATMMFQFSAGEREPLADGEESGRAQDLSPGVLLRPLWQDACLPTIAFVVGPGELGYLATSAPIYRLLGVPQPVLVPRASLTLVEPSLQRLMERFSLDLPDLEQPAELLAEQLDSTADGDLDDAFADLESRLTAELDAIGQRLERIDSSMQNALARARGKMLDELTRLRGKIKTAQENREGTGMRQLRRLCSVLRPRGRIQERVFGPLAYLVAHGPTLANTLIEVADPFRIEHAVLEF